MTDDCAYAIQQKNHVNIDRMYVLLFPLFFSMLALIVLSIGVEMNVKLRIVTVLVYFFILAGLYNKIHIKHRTSLFAEYISRNNDKKLYFTTPSLDKINLPMRDGGFVYAIPQHEEFSKPFLLNFRLDYNGKDIDFNTLYKCFIEIDGQKYHKIVYGCDDLICLKRAVIKEFENKGYRITAIRNRYGDYLWALSENPTKISRANRLYYDFLNFLIPALFWISTIIPVLAISLYRI